MRLLIAIFAAITLPDVTLIRSKAAELKGALGETLHREKKEPINMKSVGLSQTGPDREIGSIDSTAL